MNFENFTIKSQEVVQQAVQLAHSAGNQAIEPVHLLQALMQKGESVIKFIFQKTGVDARMTEMQIDNAIEKHEYIIPSSTEGSTKKFKITVDDSGTISATEVT